MMGSIYIPRVDSPATLGVRPEQPTELPSTSRVADVLQSASLLMINDYNDARSKEAVNSFRQTAREKYVEMMSKQGGDAVGGVSKYKEWYNKALSDHSTKLENENQRSLFRDNAMAMGERDLDSISVHEASQAREHLISVADGVVTTYKNEALLNPSVPTLKAADEAIVNSITKARPGMDNTKEIARARAEVYITAAESIANSDPRAARAFLEEHKAVIGGAYISMSKDIRSKEIIQSAQDKADNIISMYPTDYANQLKVVNEIKDAETRTRVTEMINARHQDKMRVEHEMTEQITSKAINSILAAKSYSSALNIAYSVPDGKTKLALIEIAKNQWKMDEGSKAEAREAQRDAKRKNSMLAYVNAMRDIDNKAPLSDVVKRYGQVLEPEEFSKVLTYHKNGGNMDGVSDSTVRGAFETLTGESPKKNPAKYAKVWDFVTKNIDPTKKPTDNDIRKLVGDAVMAGEEMSGSWYKADRNMTYSQAVSEGVQDKWLPDVTSDERKAIIKELEKKNAELREQGKIPLDINDKNIRLYKKRFNMGR